LDGAKNVRIHGQMHPVRARIAHIQGFSAHADMDELLKWLSRLSAEPRLVFLTHGETRAAESFKAFLKEKTGYKVTIPSYGERVRLV
jgi:metallo-beta-lactamase family protein